MKIRTYFFYSLLFCCLLGTTASLNAQHRNCSAMDHLHQAQMSDPSIIENMEAIERFTRRTIEERAGERDGLGVITIPVVFHVVYRSSTENISDAQIQSQLTVLNEDFRRTNSDANNTWSQAADTEIEFCLATVDPNGNATSGITRTSTSVNGFGTNDSVKRNSSGGKDAWPSGDYLNFWVCNIGGGILGYAQFPGGSAATDGVVCDYRYTGTVGTATAPFNLGRTATHEVGHWLNLRHIWGDGNCSADDFVSDTPNSDGANYGCATGHVSCSSTDMVQNYMDYSDDACMNLYTQGQKDRMRALFASGGARASLLNSGGCGASGPVATCNDGIQNQGETGVDCGGPCTACACDGTNVNISITLDNYPEETSWSLTNASGQTVASGGTYGSVADGTTLTGDFCLADGCYTFTINDAYGDGICCSYGNGSYSVTSGGTTYASGGSFASSESTNFCVGGGGGPTPTCNDGIQNGDETGIDCGGSACAACPTCNDGVQNGNETGVDCGGSCAPCATCNDGVQNGNETGIDCGGSCSACPTCNDGVQNGDETGVDCGGSCTPCNTGGGGCSSVTIDISNFESGLGIWNDGGSDCRRSSQDAAYANSGSYCVRLRDNTSTSTMTTDNLNLGGFEEVTVSFSYYVRSFEGTEDFWLQASTDGGASYQTLKTYTRGTDFNNNERKSSTVNITGTFTNTTRFRFRADASGNSDWVYIDDVSLTGCANSTRGGSDATIQANVETLEEEVVAEENGIKISSVRLFPNPAAQFINVEYETSLEGDVEMMVVDMMGRTVFMIQDAKKEGYKKQEINVSNLESGYYMVIIRQGDAQVAKKFVKL